MFFGKGHLIQKFDTCRTAFLCCDIQQSLATRIPNFQEAVRVSNVMTGIHDILPPKHRTYVATEQFPQGVGHIAPEIKLPAGTPVFAKTQPSMLTADVLPYILGDKEKGLEPVQQAILWGHETHVCITGTIDDLLSRNIRVALVVDGCASQKQLDHDVTLMGMTAWPGLTMTTTVGVIMQLSKGDERMMKQIMSLMKAYR